MENMQTEAVFENIAERIQQEISKAQKSKAQFLLQLLGLPTKTFSMN
jgi:D-alanyl-D-alanine carboxypeptidase